MRSRPNHGGLRLLCAVQLLLCPYLNRASSPGTNNSVLLCLAFMHACPCVQSADYETCIPAYGAGVSPPALSLSPLATHDVALPPALANGLLGSIGIASCFSLPGPAVCRDRGLRNLLHNINFLCVAGAAVQTPALAPLALHAKALPPIALPPTDVRSAISGSFSSKPRIEALLERLPPGQTLFMEDVRQQLSVAQTPSYTLWGDIMNCLESRLTSFVPVQAAHHTLGGPLLSCHGGHKATSAYCSVEICPVCPAYYVTAS